MRSYRSVSMVFVLILAVAEMACAQTKDQPKSGGPSPEDMQKMMALMKPGPQHEVLAKMAGDWTITGKAWMDPSGTPTDMKPGSQHAEMILGGRYLQSVWTGEMMGMPFEGHGLLGYDNFRKEYLMTWVDNMGTAVSTANGSADAAGKVITLMGKMDDPSTGARDQDVKYVYTIKDDKNVTFEMYGMVPGKGLMKMMETTFTKK